MRPLEALVVDDLKGMSLMYTSYIDLNNNVHNDTTEVTMTQHKIN